MLEPAEIQGRPAGSREKAHRAAGGQGCPFPGLSRAPHSPPAPALPSPACLTLPPSRPVCTWGHYKSCLHMAGSPFLSFLSFKCPHTCPPEKSFPEPSTTSSARPGLFPLQHVWAEGSMCPPSPRVHQPRPCRRSPPKATQQRAPQQRKARPCTGSGGGGRGEAAGGQGRPPSLKSCRCDISPSVTFKVPCSRDQAVLEGADAQSLRHTLPLQARAPFPPTSCGGPGQSNQPAFLPKGAHRPIKDPQGSLSGSLPLLIWTYQSF